MAPFEELQELWQNQPAPALTRQLRRFGRQQTGINLLVKVILLACLFVPLLTRFSWAPVAVCGTVLLYTGLVTYLVLDWRNQIGISRLDFSTPSVEFVRQTRDRLRHQLNPMRRVFWLLAVSVGGGFNLILLARHGASLSQRIYEHLSATALPFAAYVLGLKIRQFRFKRECGAVLEHLDALLHSLEEHSL